MLLLNTFVTYDAADVVRRKEIASERFILNLLVRGLLVSIAEKSEKKTESNLLGLAKYLECNLNGFIFS